MTIRRKVITHQRRKYAEVSSGEQRDRAGCCTLRTTQLALHTTFGSAGRGRLFRQWLLRSPKMP
jgi:hypothetical protein